ncbi:hypothetical protein GPA22_03520 [Aromatoleum toluvorans]|uniref:High-potential iron-sulfur protein n=1 Tax=Aromatoleum toluvorans TaxID=92002 RepID=A0ABX1PUC5_9RHOO|nr:high-potential iron-sulfur protein [Aromatoleum toluvorans]NMG42805.1 hypothetical protein [Aromatoleum toluvorans]
MNPSRRSMLKLGGMSLAMIPIVALAGKNDGIRSSMKYKDAPEGDKKCANCNLFVPGASATDPGGCKVFPNDTEISPNGYCMAWAKKG